MCEGIPPSVKARVIAMFLVVILLFFCGNCESLSKHERTLRRTSLVLHDASLVTMTSSSISSWSSSSSMVYARNLPEDNGARKDLIGSQEGLAPIIAIRDVLSETKAVLGTSIAKNKGLSPAVIQNSLFVLKSKVPSEEKAFKRIFDTYSNTISYKQQFLDKNAFLVYYTQGFDGPGRESLENESPAEMLQKAQYGYRNDAFIGFDELIGEINYLLTIVTDKSTSAMIPESDTKDLMKYLNAAVNGVTKYVEISQQSNGEQRVN